MAAVKSLALVIATNMVAQERDQFVSLEIADEWNRFIYHYVMESAILK